MGAEVHSALYGTRDWAGKRATLEQTLSTPSHRAFPPKISHPKEFRDTILESHTALYGTRGWEGKQNERQEGKQNERQEGKRGGELRRWV